MGLFESFGKNEFQKDTATQNSVTEEKERQEAADEQPVEKGEGVGETRKGDFEAFKSNLDEWYNNDDKVLDLFAEEEMLRSKISKAREVLERQKENVRSINSHIDDKESDLDQVKKTGYGKSFSQDGFTVNGNLLPTLETDSNNGYMTERQKVYLSSQVDEVCREANISSIDKLRKIINAFFQSNVVDTICDNSVLPQLIYKKQNQSKIRAAVIAFVLVFLLFIFSGDSRTLFTGVVALVGSFSMMGLAGYGAFYLAREKFVWNLLVSVLVTIPAGFAGAFIFIFLADPVARIIINGNILAVAFVSLLFAVLAYFIESKLTESSRSIEKLSQDQGLLKESRKAIYAELDNSEVQGLPINTYIYCLLHYQDIIEYLNKESLKNHIKHENDEIKKKKKQRDDLQKEYDRSSESIMALEQLLISKEEERRGIVSKNAEIYEKICRWIESPKLSWLKDYEIDSRVPVFIHNGIFTMEHEGKTPLLVESSFENIEEVFSLVKEIIKGLQRMNPVELLDIAVVDLALNAQNWRYQDIPWLFSQTNVDGTKTTSGSVKLVSNPSELKIYCSELESEVEKQMTFFQSHKNDKVMEDILKDSDGRSIRELNQYMKKSDNMPFKYHITIILPENIRSDCAMLIRNLSSGVYCGFIPIILKKRNSNLPDEWKMIIEKANCY